MPAHTPSFLVTTTTVRTCSGYLAGMTSPSRPSSPFSDVFSSMSRPASPLLFSETLKRRRERSDEDNQDVPSPQRNRPAVAASMNGNDIVNIETFARQLHLEAKDTQTLEAYLHVRTVL